MRSAAQQNFFDSESNRYITYTLGKLDKRDWTVSERESYIRHMANFIVENSEIFDNADVDHAEAVKDIDFGDDVTRGASDLLGEFFGEFASQADRINPFSESNTLKTVVGIGFFALLALGIATR